jgi:hypothetical protein
MSNDWDKRPWAEIGNKSANEIFVAVGKASSHWELVEQAIAGLFTIITVGAYYAPMAPTIRAYSSISSSHNRICENHYRRSGPIDSNTRYGRRRFRIS